MPTINGHNWTSAIFAGADGYGYLEDSFGTGNPNFPEQFGIDLLAHFDKYGFDLETGLIAGKPYASEVVARHVCVRAFSIPIGLTGTRGSAAVTATADATFTLKKNGVAFGTMTFGAGSGVVGTLVSATGATFAEGDVLTIEAPASQDATLADFALSVKGSIV